MSTRIAPVPQGAAAVVSGSHSSTSHHHRKSGSFHRPQNSSEGTLLMSDGEDPFMDSPASVLGKSTSASTDSGAATHPDATQQQGTTAKQQQQQHQSQEFDSPTDVASQVNAPALDDTTTSTNQSNPITTSSDRGNYTSLVRDKYFGTTATAGAASGTTNATALHSNHRHNNSNATSEEGSRVSSTSNLDFSEIFESYSETPTSSVIQQEGRVQNGESNTPSLRCPLKQNFTPPLTLYASSGGINSATTNQAVGTPTRSNPFTTESAGIMSPVDTGMVGRGISSAMNTPTSVMTSDAVAGSMTGSLASSAASSVMRSSIGSASNPSSSLLAKQQPVLYSAIGSLEQVNTGSLRNLNKRLLAPSKDFCRIGAGADQTTLIPPLNERKSLLAAVSNTDLQQGQDRTTPPTSNSAIPSSNNHSKPAPEQPPDVTAKTNKTKKINGMEVFGVLKKKSSQNRDEAANDDAKGTGKRSNLRSSKTTAKTKGKSDKKVSYDDNVNMKKKGKRKGPIEMFRPSSDAYTPRIERKSIEYRAAEARTPVQQMASPMGTLQRPNFRDALRRVAMIIHQHVVKIENRFEGQSDTKLAGDDGLFKASMRDMFNEDTYRTPTYKCNMVRIPMARPGMVYGLRKIKVAYDIPSETEIYEFGHQLFKSVQLSSECSIVCLIYVERLMEQAKVPLLACTWRPIFMCGLLLASKVWQDLSSWNIEFASVYPQFSLESINKLELNFLRNVKWDLYISSSLYAKYYFALRSLVEKQDFRQRYNRMVGGVDTVAQSEALKVQKRTEQVKEEALLQLSRSM